MKYFRFFNFYLFIGVGAIVVSIMQFSTGYYTTGKFGPIYPGKWGPLLSLVECIFGIIFVIYGIKFGINKVKSNS